MKRWLLLLTIASMPLAPATAQETGLPSNIEVAVQRVKQDSRTFYKVDAKAFARAAPQPVWKVLTAYDRLTEFVPNLESSKILSRNGHEAIVEQGGRAGFLFISHSVHLVLRVVEQPISVIDITLLSGDMKHYASHWEITAAERGGANGTLISYSGELEPDFFVPALFGAALIRTDVRNMMTAVIREIESQVRPD